MSTPLFKKIKKDKKPIERTLYFGQTKKIILQKNNSDCFPLENMNTSSTLMNDTISYDISRSAELKPKILFDE